MVQKNWRTLALLITTYTDTLVNYYKLNSALDFLPGGGENDRPERTEEFHLLGDRLEPPKPPKPQIETKPEISFTPSQKRIPSSLYLVRAATKLCIPWRIVVNNSWRRRIWIRNDREGSYNTSHELSECYAIASNYGHRVVKTKWAKNKEISFLTGVRIIGLDDVGVINKITNLISGELRININALTVEAKEGLFEGSIKVYVHDKEELEELVKRLKQLNGIHSVDRFDTEVAETVK
jgi:GTP pyrophosphokinase